MERKQEGKASNSFLTFGSSLAPSGTSWCNFIILFCSYLPLETQKAFESVHGCSWTVRIFTLRLIQVHTLFIWDFFPLHIIYLWCQLCFPGAWRISNTVGVGRTKLPHANGERGADGSEPGKLKAQLLLLQNYLEFTLNAVFPASCLLQLHISRGCTF